MANTKTDLDAEKIPIYIEKRLKSWEHQWRFSVSLHYILGILSVILATLAAMDLAQLGTKLAAGAAVTSAIFTFLHPERRYHKFSCAWRELDLAVMRRKNDEIETSELIDAVARGEQIITDFESSKVNVRLENDS